MKKFALAAAVAAIPLMGSLASADTVGFDVDGVGGLPAVNITGLDLDPNNALAVGGGAGPVYTQLFHARVSALQGSSGTPGALDTNGLDNGVAGAFEITVVLGYTGTAVALAPGNIALGLAPVQPVNFFEMYFDTTVDSNSLAGTGFDDGRLIMRGDVTSAVGNLIITGGGLGTPLDQNGANNYPGQDTLTAFGGLQLGATIGVTNYDPTFFIVPPPLTIEFGTANSNSSLPFTVVDPSAIFDVLEYAGAIGSNSAGNAAYAPIRGPINGLGPDIQIQTDANIAFAVPTPGAAWGGMALLGMLGAARARRARA